MKWGAQVRCGAQSAGAGRGSTPEGPLVTAMRIARTAVAAMASRPREKRAVGCKRLMNPSFFMFPGRSLPSVADNRSGHGARALLI